MWTLGLFIEAAGLTQLDVARAAGLSKDTVHRAVTYGMAPSASGRPVNQKTLEKIAAVLGEDVKTDEFSERFHWDRIPQRASIRSRVRLR